MMMRINTLTTILQQYHVENAGLIKALIAVGEATSSISRLLSNYVDLSKAGTQNSSGDDQLMLDIECDNAVFEEIKKSGVFVIAASEETPVETNVLPESVSKEDNNSLYSIGFDPLDGSSIIDANFSVGSIFGIWSGNGVLGRKGCDQVASAMSAYGPRTTLCIALPSTSRSDGHTSTVLEVTLIKDNTEWVVSRDSISLLSKGKVFAPGNLRASNDNIRYNNLIQYWIAQRYTLRYSGGMVPDVYHILSKKKGVFSNVSSEKARAKLRLLYEVAPIGLIIECAGGATTHEAYDKSVLDIVIDDLDKRLGVCFGSVDEVAIYKEFIFGNEKV